MTTHYPEARNLVNKGVSSDSFAKHFASHFEKNDNKKKEILISANQIWKLGKIDILWQGNPISAMKTFGKLNCILCMNERLQLLKALKVDKMENTRKLINSSNELYGACRHKTKFHRYQICETSSTDEGLKSPKKSDVETLLNTPL